jgi:hypothetical protein
MAYCNENKNFVKFIRQYFKTTYEFKNAMGISWPTAKRWEAWPALMSLPAVYKLSELTGVKPGTLVEYIYTWQYNSVENPENIAYEYGE